MGDWGTVARLLKRYHDTNLIRLEERALVDCGGFLCLCCPFFFFHALMTCKSQIPSNVQL